MYRHIMIAALLVSLLQPTAAQAVKFKRVITPPSQLCHSLQNYLDRHPLLSRHPPELPVEPGHNDFQAIKWRSLDPTKNLVLIRRIVTRLVAKDPDISEGQEDDHWRRIGPEVRKLVKRSAVGLGVARMDIDNDGKLDTVYRYGFQPVVTAYPKTRLTYYWKYFIGVPGQQQTHRQLHIPVTYKIPAGFDAFKFRGRVHLVSTVLDGLWIGQLDSAMSNNRLGKGPHCWFRDVIGKMTEPSVASSSLWKFYGADNPVCRAVVQNLGRFPKLPLPMAEMPIHQESLGMAAIEWQRLDPQKNDELLRNIRDFQRDQTIIMATAPDSVWLKPLPTLRELARSGTVGVQRARFDLDNDGILETVYRYGAQPYTIPRPRSRKTFYWQYFLLPETQVHEAKKTSNKILALSMAGQFFEAFRYQKKTYLARLDYGGGGIEIRARGVGGHFRKCMIFPIRQ